MADAEVQEVVRKVPKFVMPLAAAIVVLLLGGGLTAYFVQQKPEVLGLSKGQSQVQQEVNSLVTDVGKLIELPKDESPTIATVTDVEKVKEQPFFKSAKNEDKVLIYTNARKAILYRPSEKRIIEVGAVNINQQEEPQVEPSPAPEE